MTEDETNPTPEEMRGFLVADDDAPSMVNAVEAVEDLRGKNSVHENRLKELVEKYQDKAEGLDIEGQTDYGKGQVKVYRRVARDLAEMIDDA